ncbi:MAG TPA: hypothetical protein VGC41_26445, partial [Kofleriaceae bacterium]
LGRHRAIVAVTTVAVVVLALGGVLAIRRILDEERHADAEREIAIEQKGLAERNAAAAGELVHFMMFDLHTKLEHVGKLDLLDAVAHRSATYYDERGDSDPVQLATARESIGTVLEAKGDLEGALAEYKKGQVAVAKQSDPKAQRMSARLLARIGSVQATRRDVAAGLASTEAALKIVTSVPPSDPDVMRDEIFVRDKLLAIYDIERKVDQSIAMARAIGGLWERLAKSDHASVQLAVEARERMASRLAEGKDGTGAIAEFRADLAVADAELAKQPSSAVWIELVRALHADLGRQLAAANDQAGALGEFRTELSLAEKRLALDPTSAVSQEAVAHAHEHLGRALLRKKPRDRKDLADAVLEARASLALRTDLVTKDPTNAAAKRALAVTHHNLGEALDAANDVRGAQAEYRAALAIRQAIFALDATNVQAREEVVRSHVALAKSYGAKDNPRAIAELRAAIAILQEDSTAHPAAPTIAWNLALEESDLAEALVRGRDRAGAKTQLAAAIATADRMAALADAWPEWKPLGLKLRAKLAALH